VTRTAYEEFTEGSERPANGYHDSTDRQRDTVLQPVIVRLADVQPTDVEWLWPGRIAVGKLTLVAGDPGLGKSFLSLDIAARVSDGGKWPDCESYAPLGSVVILTAEDDLSDTVRPRLDVAGANTEKITAIQAVRGSDDDGSYERPLDLQRDLSIIEQVLDDQHDTKLLIVDPISAYLGKTDSHSNSEVRAVLAPLADLASRHSIAILALTHLRKSEGAAVYRAMGSLAFAAAARAVWGVAADKSDKARRLFVPIKNNLARDSGGLAYTLALQNELAKQPVVVWEAEPITTTADEAMEHSRPHPANDEAVEFLRDALADGPRPTKEVEEEAREAHGITQRTLYRARKTLNVEAYRPEHLGAWYLRLPPS
jgi:hypothetical protein